MGFPWQPNEHSKFMIQLSESRNMTEEFEARERLKAVPNLRASIKSALPQLFIQIDSYLATTRKATAPRSNAIKARALQALRGPAANDAQELFVDALIREVEEAQTRVVLFFPCYDACFS